MKPRPVGAFFAIVISLCALALGLMASPAESTAPLGTGARPLDLLDSAPASPSALITVTNTADTGAGSLRNTIDSASSGSTIVFSLTLPATITLSSGELLVNKNLTISGPGMYSLTVSGNNATRVFDVIAGGSGWMNLSGLAIKNGRASGSGGGGIVVQSGTVRVTDTLIFNNVATNNGGGFYLSSGFAWLTNCEVVSNTTGSNYGGGIYTAGPITLSNVTLNQNRAGYGGGIYDHESTIVMTNVTVSNNRADTAGGFGNGGGIGGSGMTAYLWNSTIFSNTAVSNGGGIYSHGGMTLTNVTLSGNSASITGGGNIYRSTGTGIALKNTIVAGAIPESSRNCNVSGALSNIMSLGHNLESANHCLFANTHDITNTNPFLGPLANNGGSTKTLALLPGSKAIDAGEGCPPTDQRGTNRPIGSACDIGAYEAWRYVLLPLIMR